MKIKFGSTIVEGRGKIGGHVASRNRAGAYLRTKVTPNNPQTVSQAGIRNIFTARTQAWRGLTAAQRLAWNNAVQDFIGTDIFGDSKVLSGFQLFTRLNSNLVFCGQSAITTPPTPATVPTFTTFSAAVVKETDAVTLTFTPAIGATESVILSATPGLSQGVTFAKSEYRKIDILTSADTSELDATTAYETKFGAVPAIGKKVFFKAKQIVNASGLASAESICSTIVEAAE